MRSWWVVGAWMVAACGGDDEASEVSEAVVAACASACADLESHDDCSDELDACIDECESVAGAYEEECGICVAQASGSNGGDGCENVTGGYPGCEDVVFCNYEVASATDDACSSVCGE